MRKLIFELRFLFSFIFIAISFCQIFQLNAHKKENKYDLVICALFRNEELFIKEWIEFHKLVGVKHFYLYDNGSTDGSLQILQPYIEANVVEVFSWPLETHNQDDNLNSLQLPVYRNALKIVKKSATWAAFIDLDEFLFPVREESLIEVLRKYTQYGGLVANWQVFGTSNRAFLHPGELLTEALIWRAPVHMENNYYFKSIVQPLKVRKIKDPHSFHYVNGCYAVNSNGECIFPGLGKHTSVVIDQIVINHYWFGTRNWFLSNKVPTKLKWGHIESESPKYLDGLISLYNVEHDTTIARFLPALREAMQK